MQGVLMAGAVAGLAVGAAPAFAGVRASAPCGVPATIADRTLHREWRIERDCAHPERPPRLVAIPWSENPPTRQHASASRSARVPLRPVVQAGMTVALWWRGREAAGRLTGIALDAGAAGDSIWVKAGLHGAVLRGVVRGPGEVELLNGGER